MKRAAKTIFALAAGLTALTSCNKNTDCHSGREIVFGISGVRVETRSLVETDIDELKDNGFRVICATSRDESQMFNTTVLYDETDQIFRNPSTRYYYPEDGSLLSFAAVYPSTETLQIEDGAAVVHYIHNPDEDLCIAHRFDVQEPAVMMNFYHLLAQITLKCAAEDETVDYRVDSIVITALNKAQFIIDLAEDDNYWEYEEDTETIEYPIVSASTAISSTMAPVGETMTFIPGNYTLKIKWSVFKKGTDERLAQYSDDITGLNVYWGIHQTFNLTLPNNVKDISFTSSVREWKDNEDDITCDGC